MGTVQASDESEEIDTQQSSEALINAGLPSDPRGYVPTIDEGESYEFFSSNVVEVFDDGLGSGDEVDTSSLNWEVEADISAVGQNITRTDYFGVLMGAPVEVNSREADLRIDSVLDFDIKTLELFDTQDDSSVEEPGDISRETTTQAPQNWISVALGTSSLLLGISEYIDSSLHAGVSIGYFLQDLTMGSTITQDASSETVFDIHNEVVEGYNESSSGNQTLGERITFSALDEGHTYRFGVAVGSTVGSWYTGNGHSEFDFHLDRIEVEAV